MTEKVGNKTDLHEDIFCIVANVVNECFYGEDKILHYGTKHFSPGTKVYIIDWYLGTCERVMVVGLHKRTKKLIAIVISVDRIENVRVQKIYQPKIKAFIQRSGNVCEAFFIQEKANYNCKVILEWIEDLKNKNDKV